MAYYLISVNETYRTDTEKEAQNLVEKNKKLKDCSLDKYSITFKERKAKGEVIDSWYRVCLTKTYDSEKEPEYPITLSEE